ncbi:MAG: M23 family metallopeptidase [Acidobacteriota bacterium]
MRLRLLVPIQYSARQWLVAGGAASALLALSVVGAAVALRPESIPLPKLWISPAYPTPELPAPWPLSLADRAARTVEGRFRAGSTLAGVLHRAGIPGSVVDAVVSAARPKFDLHRIRAGWPYKVYFNVAGQLMLVRYQSDRQTALLVARTSAGWQAAKITIPFRIRPRYVQAQIHGSLEGSLARTSVGRREAVTLAQKIADIFAWDIDFAADLRPGDRIDLLAEERYLGEEFVGFGDLLAAELEVNGRILRAVRFKRPDGTISYFSPEGTSIRRTFLRSPVRYTRISSRFTSRRYHPILKITRPHFGVDYAAPPGTPVQVTADGVVIFVGSNSQSGRYVKVRHGGSYTSWYLHLSRFAEGLRRGKPVVQGETIAYVGKSGLATSYHLDYRLSRNGRFVDPLKVQFPAAEPVPPESLRLFYAQRDRWMHHLRQGQNKAPLLLAGGS